MDIHLHSAELGSGFPLILLHGNGENSGYFEYQMAPFAQHFRVIALDTRGHGQSPRGGAPFTIGQFAQDLLDFMDEHVLSRAHILGFSDGANIALALALKHPDRIGKMILNGGNLNPRGVKRSVQWPIEAAYRLVSLISRFDRKAVAKREMLGLMVTQPNWTCRDLETLNVPTLVIAGTRDMIRQDHTEAIHRAIPDSRLALIDGDHFVAHGNPEPFNRTVLDFLLRH